MPVRSQLPGARSQGRVERLGGATPAILQVAGQRSGARMWVTTLAEKGPLRAGLDVESAVDVLWLHMAPGPYHGLVHARGWSPERFREWRSDTLCRLLLPGR